MAKKWQKHTKNPKKLPKKVEKKAFWDGFLEKISQVRMFKSWEEEEARGADPFGEAPDILPATNVRTYLKTMHEIFNDPTLSLAEKNRLKMKLEERPEIPEPGRSTTGTLLGAGMGASAAHLLSRYLLSSDTSKARMSPLVRTLITLGALGFGGYLGARGGGRFLSLEPRIIDMRKRPEEEMFSPWKVSLV